MNGYSMIFNDVLSDSRTTSKTSLSVLIPLIKHAERVFEMSSQIKGNKPIRRFCGTWGLFS